MVPGAPKIEPKILPKSLPEASSDGQHEERSTNNGEKNQSKAPGGTTKPTWREHREHQDCECGGSRAALARALRALAGRLELERFVSFSSVFVRSFLARSRGKLRKHAARARRAFGAGAFREFLERLFSELSGSILGKAEKTCEPQRQPVALLGRYAPSPAI